MSDADTCTHDFKVVGGIGRAVAGFQFIEICQRDGCDAWRYREPDADNRVPQPGDEAERGALGGITDD